MLLSQLSLQWKKIPLRHMYMVSWYLKSKKRWRKLLEIAYEYKLPYRTHGTIGSDYIRYRYIYDRHLLNCRSPGHLIVIWKTEIKLPLMFTNWWIFCHINLLWWSSSFHHIHANLLHYFTYAVDLFFDNNCIEFTSPERDSNSQRYSGDRCWLHTLYSS